MKYLFSPSFSPIPLQAVNKEKEIQEKEKHLQKLKEILKKVPDSEETKMIPEYKDNIKQKEDQIRAMGAELTNFQEEVISSFSHHIYPSR